jgi:protein TonB
VVSETQEREVEPAGPEARELFAAVGGPRGPAPRGRAGAPLSLALHALALCPLVLIPMGPSSSPTPHRFTTILYDPPPPPPPPPMHGPGLSERPPRVAATPAPRPPDVFTQPVETPPSQPPTTLPPDDSVELGGDPDGSDAGDALGMTGGEVGGGVGGTPGGVLGGVIGGTGTLPVAATWFDRAPRMLSQVRPEYPRQAFVEKVEGEVLLEILIDASGRVVWTKVVRSIPRLDAAAREAVMKWTFAPALPGGRPVAARAMAPVRFHLY